MSRKKEQKFIKDEDKDEKDVVKCPPQDVPWSNPNEESTRHKPAETTSREKDVKCPRQHVPWSNLNEVRASQNDEMTVRIEVQQPRERNQELAAKVVILADENEECWQDLREQNAREESIFPPSVIAIPLIEDNEEADGDELDSISRSIPFVLASLVQENQRVSAKALEKHFQEVMEMLVDLQKQQYEALSKRHAFQSSLDVEESSMKKENTSRAGIDPLASHVDDGLLVEQKPPYSPSLEEQKPPYRPDPPAMHGLIGDMVKKLDPLEEQKPSYRPPLEERKPPYRPEVKKLEPLEEQKPPYRPPLEERKPPYRPDPPAMQVLISDMVKKLDPEGKIQSNDLNNWLLECLNPATRPSADDPSESSSELDSKLPSSLTKPLPGQQTMPNPSKQDELDQNFEVLPNLLNQDESIQYFEEKWENAVHLVQSVVGAPRSRRLQHQYILPGASWQPGPDAGTEMVEQESSSTLSSSTLPDPIVAHVVNEDEVLQLRKMSEAIACLQQQQLEMMEARGVQQSEMMEARVVRAEPVIEEDNDDSENCCTMLMMCLAVGVGFLLGLKRR